MNKRMMWVGGLAAAALLVGGGIAYASTGKGGAAGLPALGAGDIPIQTGDLPDDARAEFGTAIASSSKSVVLSAAKHMLAMGYPLASKTLMTHYNSL